MASTSSATSVPAKGNEYPIQVRMSAIKFEGLYTKITLGKCGEELADRVNEMMTTGSNILKFLDKVPVKSENTAPTRSQITPLFPEQIERLKETVRVKMKEISAQTKEIDLSSSSSSTPKAVEIPHNYGIGFKNAGANCWANSLLQMLLASPFLLEAYRAVATHFASSSDPVEKTHGKALAQAIEIYQDCFARKTPVPIEVTQNVRLAFSHLFGSISTDKNRNEDAGEALQQILGCYQSLQETGHTQSPLFRDMETIRQYTPVGEPEPIAPELAIQKDYAYINEEQTYTVREKGCQILIDLHGKSDLSFPQLLLDSFYNDQMGESGLSKYLLTPGTLQQFRLASETRQFIEPPEEFLLTLKRFGQKESGEGYKISTPVEIQRTIVLPEVATTRKTPIAYSLTSFIIHRGGYGSGHYISYRTVDGKWIEFDDEKIRFVSEREIDTILHGRAQANLTSYLHHYRILPETDQASALAEVAAHAPSSPASLFTECVERYLKKKNELDFPVKLFDQLSKEASIKTLQHLYLFNPGIIARMRALLWIDQGADPTYKEFVSRLLSETPSLLHSVERPYLLKGKANLIEQMKELQERKTEIGTIRALAALLEEFHGHLNSPSCFFAYEQLPQELKIQLEEAVQQRNGSSSSSSQPASAILNKDNINTYLTSELVLDCIEERSHVAKQSESYYEQLQLEAFIELLNTPEPDSLSTAQLKEAFKQLDLRPGTIKKIHWLIWKQNGEKGSGQKIQEENPHALLALSLQEILK